ncbi:MULTISPECIES: transporter [Vibrio]|nr:MULTISPECIES: transporter [Vibrio]MBF9000107.1 transporter [Vibrio nitrifigilis]
MDKQSKIRATFDYTSFLGASCTKKLTFAEVLGSFSPMAGEALKGAIGKEKSAEERLWDIAMDRLSSRRSDESNLINLIRFAHKEGIDEIRLIMPYALEEGQIKVIEQKAQALFHGNGSEEFIIELLPHCAEAH